MTITTLKKLEEDTEIDLRDMYYEHGLDNSRKTWEQMLKFSLSFDLVTPALKPVNAAAAQILRILSYRV